MSHGVAYPTAGVDRGRAANMALRTGWPASGDPREVCTVAGTIGTTGGTVQPDVVAMERIGEIPPLHGVKRILIAKVALGAGDLGNPAQKVRPMTIGTRLHIRLRLRLMAAGQPARHVFPGSGVESRLRMGIPTPRQPKAKRQQHPERRQKMFPYR